MELIFCFEEGPKMTYAISLVTRSCDIVYETLMTVFRHKG